MLSHPLRPRPRIVVASLLTVVTLAATAAIGLASVRSYTPSPLDQDAAQTAEDALPRLAFLRSELDNGGGERMQALFPEGYFFSSALYGLSWVNVAALDPGLRERALEEARWALERLESDQGTAPFPADADPEYGVYHAGWSAWLRGRIVELAGGVDAAPEEAALLEEDAAELDAAFRAALESGTPYLTAYPGQAWPVDSVVAIAALRLDDRVRSAEEHTPTIEEWTRAVRDRTDPATGLIPHSADPRTGSPLEGARGSSQALLLRFLAEIDPAWAARDYATFSRLFASDIAMLPGVREHPQGDGSPGDVDSGPLVFGLSASASTVALGDAVLFNDGDAADALTGFAEATGSAIETGGERRYLGGVLPVGDAFLVWSLTAGGEHAAPDPAVSGEFSGWWRVPWHVATGILLVLLWWAVLRSWRPFLNRPGPLR
ncbi:MAG: hypothetical protein M0026_05525 [Nocardiopsaceae bacterium]|nr:hypothetical protein [Nocardiopsaceae bacterium]